jgi:SAM-dependent methyltransferase/uncharacterized protein YbaR (Trm112 family)/thiamine kinase-like enzyme
MNSNIIEYAGFENLVCPYCHNQLILQKEKLVCNSCKREYPIIEGIPNFCQKDEYWCNVGRETMWKLNARARESGDWLAAAKELIPDYLSHIEPFDRADAQFLLPITSNSSILDAGSMWGGFTIPVAQYCGAIFAVDKTIETLTFLKIRAEQMGLGNIHVVASPLRNLPFSNDYFDMVILNGVLEWVAFNQEVVLEKHWGKKRTDSATYSKNPRQVQIEVLRELRRVIKPGGHLYLAIENRIGYQYLAGYPDDHMNIRFVPFLPRFIANTITKWKLNCEYRTYIYSLPGYRSLLRDSGFQDMEFYGAFPHYIAPSDIIPLTLIKYWKKPILPVNSQLTRYYKKIAAKMFPKGLLKYVSPSFIIIAKKAGGQEQEARIIQLFRKAGLLTDSANIKIVKQGGRPGNYHTANFFIYIAENDLKPAYFCKICRDKRYFDILENEANNLKFIDQFLTDTELNASIPKLLYFGTIEGITMLVTQFIEGEAPDVAVDNITSKNNLKKLDKSIQLGIGFLVKFQKYTRVRDVKAAPYLLSVIEKQKGILKENGKLTKEVDIYIKRLIEEIKTFEELRMPICAVHGDYDLCNLLVDRNKLCIVDFEHFEQEGLPFFDLSNLLFNPILMSHNKLDEGNSLSLFIDKYNIKNYLNKWLEVYAMLSGMPLKVLKILPQIAALEQQTKVYPYYRDPYTYPMYPRKAFNELLSLDIEI